jgi:hypothetical protein
MLMAYTFPMLVASAGDVVEAFTTTFGRRFAYISIPESKLGVDDMSNPC